MKPVSSAAGVLGMLSGYSIGYRMGIWNSTLHSRAVQARVLATPDIGRVIAREGWRRVLLEPVVMGAEEDASRFASIRSTQRIYADFFRIVHSFADPTTVEARLDRRHAQQRRRPANRVARDERRRRDRRSRDIRDQLHTIGWALVPAAERNV